MNKIQNLEVLIQKFKLFSKTLKKKENELDVILQRYNYFQKHYKLPLRNNHFNNCVWCNDITCEKLTDSDFCSCFYGIRFINNLCFEIIDLIALEYIVNF